ADGALAVLVPRDAGTLAALQSPERRTMVLEAARTLGFTHAAVELTEQSSGSGSGSSTESGASSTEVRLFVAVLLPGKVRAGIAGEVVPSLRERLPRAAWVRPDNLHVTLKFAGRRPEALVPELTDALRAAAAGVEPFDLVLEGVGAFPSLERPRVLWLGARDQ